VGVVAEGSPAEAAGMMRGDRIVAINGRPIRYYRDVQQFAALSAGDRATFTVERDGERVDLDLMVGRRVTTDQFGGESEVGFIGILLGYPARLAEPPEGSAAAAAGFEAGDVILAAGDMPVE